MNWPLDNHQAELYALPAELATKVEAFTAALVRLVSEKELEHFHADWNMCTSPAFRGERAERDG
jgi:hypothetical protein